MLLLNILALLTLATALPSKTNNTGKPRHCVSKNFDKPWVLHDIFVWQPLPSSTNTTTKITTTSTSADEKGSINFIFCDENKGLHLATICGGTLINGVSAEAVANGGYTPCKNSSVAFQYNKERQILMQRAYIDPCLGPPPWDGGIAFGQSETDMTSKTTAGYGQMWTQAEMLVPITAMI